MGYGDKIDTVMEAFIETLLQLRLQTLQLRTGDSCGLGSPTLDPHPSFRSIRSPPKSSPTLVLRQPNRLTFLHWFLFRSSLIAHLLKSPAPRWAPHPGASVTQKVTDWIGRED